VIGRRFRIATIFGIPVRVDLSWVLIVFLLTTSIALELRGDYPHLTWPVSLTLGLVASFLLFASVLAHELAHAIVAVRRGVRIRGITLFIFGGAAEMEDEPPDAASELMIAVAGPAMSLTLAVGFLGCALAGRGLPASVQGMFQYLARINAILVVFNIIPGFPLDGGRVLRALLWGIWEDLSLATRAACAVGSGFGLLITTLGFLAIFAPLSASPVLGVWYIFIGWFLRQLARASYRQALVRDSLKKIRVRDLMGEAVFVPPSATLEQVAHHVSLAGGLGEIPVVDAGRLLGLVKIGDIRNVDRDLWGCTRVTEIMEPEGKNRAVDLDDDASRLLSLTAGENRVVPVVRDGELVGIITSRDLMKRLEESGGSAFRLAHPGDEGDSQSNENNRYEDRK
jgi:Zn-dependent protease/predicted transcriptional regulator